MTYDSAPEQQKLARILEQVDVIDQRLARSFIETIRDTARQETLVEAARTIETHETDHREAATRSGPADAAVTAKLSGYLQACDTLADLLWERSRA